MGRKAMQRSTLYGAVSDERVVTAEGASALQEAVNTPARRYERPTGKVKLIRNKVSDLDLVPAMVVD